MQKKTARLYKYQTPFKSPSLVVALQMFSFEYSIADVPTS